jgi:autotransporter-associated beta strand protein
MLGDTTFGGPTGSRWDLRVRSGTGVGPGLKGNGYNLTKVGAGFVSIACQRNLGTNTPYWDLNLGNVVVDAGTLTFAESLTLGNPAKTITVNAGAILQLYDLNLTNPLLRNVFLNDARLAAGGGNTDTNPVNGTVTISGACSFRMDQAALIINGPIVGSGSLAVSAAPDPGRVYLNGNNTFTGDTIVTNGLFGGVGSLAGNLTMLGGTNSPGNLSGLGTFTVHGALTLAGTTLMELDRAQTPNSDRLVVDGTINNAGVLRVVLATGGAAPQAGDVYQLFNKAGTGTFSSVVLPDLSALPGGLSWNTTNLYVNGTIAVNGTPAAPKISGASVSNGNFVLTGTGGIQGNSYTILSSTNLAVPVGSWTPVATNVFGPGGTFGFTNAMNPSDVQTFYLLRIP